MGIRSEAKVESENISNKIPVLPQQKRVSIKEIVKKSFVIFTSTLAFAPAHTQ